MIKKDKKKKQKNLIEEEQVNVQKWKAKSIPLTVISLNLFILVLILAILSTFFSSKVKITQDEVGKNFIVTSSVYQNVASEAKPLLTLSAQEQDNFVATGNDSKSIQEDKIPNLFDNFYKSWNEFYPERKIKFLLVLSNRRLYEIYRYSEDHNKLNYQVDWAKSGLLGNSLLKLTEYGSFNVKKDIKIVPLRLMEDDFETVYMFIGLPAVEKPKGIYNDVFTYLILCFLITLNFSITLSRKIKSPLQEMEKKISQMSEGDLSERLEYTKLKEINQLVQAYNELANTMQRLYSTLEAKVQDRTKELKSAYAELQNTQAIMVHSEKMKSLGELVAGIMHEINNPINFIYGNMTHLDNYSKDLIQIIEAYEKYEDELKEEIKKDVNGIKKDIDYDFLKSDMPDLIKSCKEGAERAKNIIQDLKSFSRMEEAAISDVDIPHEIDMTLNILHNKIKHKAEVHKEYIDYVPKIEAFGGQLNQVFMNIIDNAVGAIKEKGDIWIRIKTNELQSHLIIEIEDNGIGMDAETCNKTFDPFFTTKPVGQGTGLGMSIAHRIIKSHQGEISVSSKKDEGTKFTIKLPLKLNRETLTADLKNKGEIIDG